MARTVALYAFPAVLVAAHWGRLESGGSAAEAAWIVLLALLPALVRPRVGRAAAALAVAIVAAQAAFGLSLLDARPFDDRHDYFGPLLSGLRRGALDFYDVGLPFSVAEQPLMNAVVLMATFGFCLAVSLALAARQPLVAGLALLAGAAWPATLISGGGVLRGAIILAGVLMLLAAAGRRPARSFGQAAFAGGLLVVAAVTATASPAVAKGEFLSWKRWDPYDRPEDPVSVRYVWNANYRGIQFPEKKTTVLRVQGPTRALYWRATTLDVFDGNRWIEQLGPLGTFEGAIELPADPLLPPAARERRRWVRADVTIEALRDRRLPGPSSPVAYDPRGMGPIDYHVGGAALAVGGLERDDRYSIWAYAPRPTPAQLARSRSAPILRNGAQSRYLQIAPGAPTPSFGDRGRETALATLLAHEDYGPLLQPYRPLYEQARAVAGRPSNPYAAVVALEAWFRSQGGFVYDERPPFRRGTPPLVSFVTETKRGYCQYYAGAMALMLRWLGIPARVAAGFTSGTYDRDRRLWVVTDHDAHAWVEVWFEGWGWLPFDPTPGRGRLSGTYTAASASFNAPQAQEAADARTGLGLSILGELARTRLEGANANGRDVPADLPAGGLRVGDRGASLLRLLALVGAVLIAAIVLSKFLLRRARYLTRDPRRVASACRSELVDFLADQRLEVSRSATVDELAATVARELSVPADAFARATSAARYAPPDRAPAAAKRARRELGRLLRRLRRRLSAVQRVRGIVSVRSLGLRG